MATVAGVPSTPTLPRRVAATACTAAGCTTPSTSTPSVVCISRSRSAGSAAAVAELHATTSSLIRRAISASATSSANACSSPAARAPYGQPRRVGQVQVVLVRQPDEQLVQHGQPADAGVEDPDGPAADLIRGDGHRR